MALQSILVSPRFVFRMEGGPATEAATGTYRLADLDLASRLSFFIWGTGPDAELIKAAELGQLTTRAGIEKQARRLLADKRSEALSTRFASQWLRLQDLEKLHPEFTEYPLFDETLRDAMRRETELFFDSLVREDRNALDLLNADYSFVNERLARHYGISGVNGAAFKRVTLPDYRRGLLGQASILTLTSVADRTSPVLRGKWVMEVLLGTPPPPPPPNVPTLDESVTVLDRRQAPLHAPAHGGAPQEPGLHVVPQGDRPARPRARQLRRHRRLAHQGQRGARGRGRRPLRRHARWRARSASATRC